MEFKMRAMGVAVALAVAFTGMTDVYAETASGTSAPSGMATLSGSVTSSGAVRKRTNVRTVRTVASTGSTATGASAVTATSDPVIVEKNPTDIVTASPSATAPFTVRKSARETGTFKTATGSRSTNGLETESGKMDAGMSAGLVAGLWMLGAAIQVIMLAITLFFGFCLYKIATKLGEPHAWLGFIPYVQTYTFVKCWGKSGWWVLWITIGYMALFIPGIILTVLVMHGISKRYGRGAGTTALFFFFPYVMLPVLAFSEPAVAAGNGPTTGYAPAYSPNVQGIPAQSSTPVANPVVESIFAPETPVSAPADAALETTASPAAVDTFAPTSAVAPASDEKSSASPEVETGTAIPAPVVENPIAKEAEAIVDNGPGFKLPGA